MTRLIVEVGFGYTVTDSSIVWTDLTRRVDVVTSGVTVDNRGAQDEQSETQAATCTLTFDDSDGALTPGRASSPYYPNVKKNVPIRVSVATLDSTSGSAPWPLAQLGDDFDDDRINTTVWSGNYGGPTESGGRALVPCNDGVFAGYQTARSWTLTGSNVGIKVATLSTPGASTECTNSIFVNSQTAGTRIGIEHNRVTGQLRFQNDTGYFDGGATVVTYNPALHGWLRIREASGTVYWETSSDGYTWTVRRSLATPAWVGTDTVTFSLEAHRTGGVNDHFEVEMVGATVHPRFFGMVNQWPVKWGGLYSTVSITCTDIFKRLSSAPALRPMLIQEVLLDGPLAYYPMGEGSESTSAGDESGAVGPGSLTIQQTGSGGTLVFGGSAGPTDSLGAPTFTPDDLVNGQYLRADLGEAFRNASTTDWIMVEAWFSTVTQGRNILTVFTSDEGRYIIFYLAGGTGFLTVESRHPTSGGAVTTTVGATNLANGAVHHLVYDSQSKEIVIDGTSLGTHSSILTLVSLDTLNVGASQNGNNLWQGSVSHVALYATTALTTADLTTHYTAGTTVYSGESADVRIARLASYAGMTTETSGTVFSPIERQVGLGRSALEHMREVERTEDGRLFSSRSSANLVFQSRSVRYNPVAAFSVEYADLETGDVELADDDQKMVNTLNLTRPTGAEVRVVDQAARDTYGPYEPSPLELFTTTDDAMVDRGNWIIGRYADPPPELRTIPMEASTLGLTTYRAILNADISTAFTIASLPDQAPAATMTCTIEGYSETITHNQHKISFHASRTDLDTRWVLDDATYSVLGTTTRLGF